jgi:hypothetical protein
MKHIGICVEELRKNMDIRINIKGYVLRTDITCPIITERHSSIKFQRRDSNEKLKATPRRRVFPEKLIVVVKTKIFSAFNGTQSFITAFT